MRLDSVNEMWGVGCGMWAESVEMSVRLRVAWGRGCDVMVYAEEMGYEERMGGRSMYIAQNNGIRNEQRVRANANGREPKPRRQRCLIRPLRSDSRKARSRDETVSPAQDGNHG